MPTSLPTIIFVCSAFLVQGLLILNFLARNLRPALEIRYGWVIYALGLPAFTLGLYFGLAGEPWHFAGPFLIYSVWAAFGFYIDRVRRLDWRRSRHQSIMVPYVAMFMASQILFWIPLWFVGFGVWLVYALFYTLNTALNILSHINLRPEMAA